VAAIDSTVQELSGDVGETRAAVGEVRGDIAKLQTSVDGLTTKAETLWVKTELYTVKRGDTLESVSRQFYGDPSKWNFIRLVNGLDRTRLREGEVLRIPSPAPWVTEGGPAAEPESPAPSPEPGAD
jgi:nucleoid-associated protein YgaU